MTKPIRLNAFVMNTVGHQCTGLWRHPKDQSYRYNTLAYWCDLARILERGLFDGVFIADVVGIYDVYGGSPDAAIRSGTQVPINDPMMIIPAMAAITQDLGFGVTASVSYDDPFIFARRMSTLDHLTEGRIAWNVVTSFHDSAARAAGRSRQLEHDQRYDLAEEYLSLVYRLWEESWDDDAVVRNRELGVFTRPEKVRPIHHEGSYFKLDAIHLCEPSRQRTPVLYQAGASAKGLPFAARHAECIFINGPSKKVVSEYVRRMRAEIAKQSRNSEEVCILNMITVIVAATDDEAQHKLEEYRGYVGREGSFALLSGWSGIDLSKMPPDDPVMHQHTQSMQTGIERFTVADPNKVWTVGEMADFNSIGGAGPVLVGSPSRIVDEMESWIEQTGTNGFALAYTLMPQCYVDFVDLVVPEMQRRGLYKTAYTPGTLREKMFGAGPRLGGTHPAARAPPGRCPGSCFVIP